MLTANYYHILEINQQATAREIKQAYRRLAKKFHPDSQPHTSDNEKIIMINAAYEVLKDSHRRSEYDQTLQAYSTQRQTRSYSSSKGSKKPSGLELDLQVEKWLQKVYFPINCIVTQIIYPLDKEIDYLAADIYDDQLMEAFQFYLEDCQGYLQKAQSIFNSQSNPAKLATTAANLYYCLNQISDGLEQLQWFTLNYDDYYLHTGKELFRIAQNLRYEAQSSAKSFI
jgi:molecular chaperone DnaJ